MLISKQKFIQKGESMTVNQKNTLLSPKKNSIFQFLFGEKGAEDYTADFVAALLGKEVKQIQLLNDSMYSKLTKQDLNIDTIDMKVMLQEGQTVYVSMKIGSQPSDLYNMYQHCIELKKTTFQDNLPLYTYMFWEDNLIGEDIQGARVYLTLYEETPIENFIGMESICFANIERLDKTKQHPKFLQWLEFMQNPESEIVEQYAKQNPAIQQAMEKLRELSDNPEMQFYEAMDIVLRKKQTETSNVIPQKEEERAIENLKTTYRYVNLMRGQDINKLNKEFRNVTDLSQMADLIKNMRFNKGVIKSITVMPKNVLDNRNN